MHLGVALAQVKDEAADVTRLKAVPNCEQKWDHAKKRLLNKETYLKDAFFVSRSLDKVGEKMTWFIKAIAATKKHDPSVRSTLEIIITYPGFHALFWHRWSHFLFQHRWYFLAKLTAQFWRFLTGIEIHPGAQIGQGVFIDHGMGVVIGETAIIEDDVVLFHGVTLGGTGKERGKRHPTVKTGAFLSAHAQILGPVTIGERAKIGANAVVLKDIPAEATAVGIPAKIVRIKGKKVTHDD